MTKFTWIGDSKSSYDRSIIRQKIEFKEEAKIVKRLEQVSMVTAAGFIKQMSYDIKILASQAYQYSDGLLRSAHGFENVR
ncbi:hypothetical protein [Fulvitalea axinellae]